MSSLFLIYIFPFINKMFIPIILLSSLVLFRSTVDCLINTRHFVVKNPYHFEYQDMFDDFEKYSLEGDIVRQQYTAHRIYQQLNDLPPIISLDWQGIVQFLEKELLSSSQSSPKLPMVESEIVTDSFEEYLQKEFYQISKYSNLYKENVIDFHTFYKWKEDMGILLNVNETYDIYKMVLSAKNNYYCTVIEFIMINYLIERYFTGAQF